MSAAGPKRGPDSSGLPTTPAGPTPAATVVLVRDSAEGPEVFLVQRNQRIRFMGGMYVFPGGKLSAEDAAPELRARLRNAAAHGGAWGDAFGEQLSAALAVAAIRETFEEAGVLLGVTGELERPDDLRARLLAGESFGQLLNREDFELDLARLVPLARWITPAVEPRRYDTCFYVARAPAGQEAAHDQSEVIAARWRSPRRALDEMASGSIRLSPPTARTLESLLPCETAEAVIALARSRTPPLIEPIIRTVGDEVMIFFPGDSEHPVRERALPGATRAVLRRK